MVTGITNLTSATFDETIASSEVPVVVDFWAEWCGPCKMISPILGEIASEHLGQLTVTKLNVDEHPDLARRYDVMSIPTLLVFDGGEPRKRVVGAKGKGQLLEELSRIPGNALPLKLGLSGDAVRDLQRRLTAAGFAASDAEPGLFCPETDAAVRAFQSAHGLHPDGVVDDQTWAALVEASFRLGDRLLAYRTPMLRGDDVVELQTDLGRLGFDAGRVDGIFGARTAVAVAEFQRNSGLHPDGIFGFETFQALRRLSKRTGATPVAEVREQEALLRSSPRLADKRIVVGELGGLGSLSRAVSKGLRRAGARVLTLDDPDGSLQAAVANRFQADVYLGLSLVERPGSVAYYAVAGFESVGGRRLAELLRQRLGEVLPMAASGAHGMRLPVLRETRMPAVLCELGPATAVASRSPRLAAAVTWAVETWVATPIDEPPSTRPLPPS